MSRYDAEQKQRAMERQIRKERSKLAGLDTAIKASEDDELKTSLKNDFDNLSVKLKSHEAKYKDFSYKTGLPPQKQRLQMYGFNRSVSQKAVHSAQSHYDIWRKSIGADDTPKTLAKYYDMKYNDTKQYELLQGYVKAVEKVDISPLVGFDLYKKTATDIEDTLIGIETVDGVNIKTYTTHFIDRVIGRVADPHEGYREATKISSVLDALQNGDVSEPYIKRTKRKNGEFFDDIRQTYTGNSAKVTISILENKLIQCNPYKRQVK